MNESIFVLQIIFVIGFSLGALRLGKEALIANVAIQAILANLFVLKQMVFFKSFQITCSDAFAIGSLLSLNLLREFYGKKSSAKAIGISFFFMIFFVIASQIHLLYAPIEADLMHIAYERILKHAPRLLITSLGVFFIVQYFDLHLFGWMEKLFRKTSFLFRNLICLTISQLIDTLLFTFLGLYGLVASVFDVFLMSFLIKMLLILSLSPVTLFAKRFVRHEI